MILRSVALSISELNLHLEAYKKRRFSTTVTSILIVLITTVSTMCVYGQRPNENIEHLVENYFYDLIENQEEANVEDFNTIMEEVQNIINQPIDLNAASYDDLSLIPILSDREINALIDHRRKYGDFADIYELQAVKRLSSNKWRLLSYLLYVDAPRSLMISQLLYDKNTLFLKSRYRLQKERGYRLKGDIPPYSGSRPYLYARWRRDNPNGWTMGITLEKDAGEQLWRPGTGVDFISAFVQKKNLTKIIKNLIIGDYHMQIGTGLMMQTGFANGKTSLTTQVQPRSRPLRPYTSSAENAALRGLAADLKWADKWYSKVLLSSRKHDGNKLYVDDGQLEAISSLQTSGLHRTSSEIEDADAVDQSISGISLSYHPHQQSRVELSAITLTQSVPLRRSNRLYNQYRWQGDKLTNLGLNFSHMIASTSLSGELAHSIKSGWARSITAVSSLDPKLDIAILYRDFDRDYHAIRGATFSERSAVENEQGLYVGLEYRHSARWFLSAYADHWQHDWLRFGADAPTDGADYLLRLTHRKKRKREIYLQWRSKRTQQNGKQDRTYKYVADRSTHKLRFHWSEIISPHIEMRSRAEITQSTFEDSKSNGTAAYIEGIWTGTPNIALSGRVMYFDTDDRASSIYAYERDLQYEFSIPGFIGKGWRLYALAKWRVNRELKAEVKLAHTKYTDDRTKISSGNTEIMGKARTDLKVQLRYKF